MGLGLEPNNRLILSPTSIDIGEFVLAAFGTPLKCSIHPVATGTDPLIFHCINQHSFSSSTLKLTTKGFFIGSLPDCLAHPRIMYRLKRWNEKFSGIKVVDLLIGTTMWQQILCQLHLTIRLYRKDLSWAGDEIKV